MKEISRPYCQKMINDIAQLITSVKDIKIQANQVFKYALKMDIISRNPLEHVTIPRQKKEMINDDNVVDERNY